jgi:hypothetical protein
MWIYQSPTFIFLIALLELPIAVGLGQELSPPTSCQFQCNRCFACSIKMFASSIKKMLPLFQLRQKKGYSVATYDLEHHSAMNFLTPAGYLFLGFRLKNFGTPKHIQDDLPQGDPRLLRSKALHLFRAPNGHRWYLPCWTRLPIMGHAMPAYIGEINSEHIGLARAGFRSPSQCNGGKVSGLLQKSWNPSGKLTMFYW